jgi:dipeptidyl aminopeptidase/acylaminoacyl peptidase
LIHGGPYLAHGPTPWLEMVALADAGFTVLYGNPRGSIGYGRAYAASIDGNWGETDDSDLMRLVDWAIRQRLAPRDKVGLLGLSYGG